MVGSDHSSYLVSTACALAWVGTVPTMQVMGSSKAETSSWQSARLGAPGPVWCNASAAAAKNCSAACAPACASFSSARSARLECAT
jgi:hypothetical protein